jgi:hypothetical protein
MSGKKRQRDHPPAQSARVLDDVNISEGLFITSHLLSLTPHFLFELGARSVQPTDSTYGHQDSHSHEYFEQVWRRHLNSSLNAIIPKYSRRPCSESKLSAAEKRASAKGTATWFGED